MDLHVISREAPAPTRPLCLFQTRYGKGDHGAIELRITNIGKSKATVILLDAYTGDQDLRLLRPWPDARK